MGVIAWNTFVLRIEHVYIIVIKSEKFLDMGELTFHAEITTLPIAAVNQSTFTMANNFLKLHKKHSIKAAGHGIRQYIIRYLSARQLVLATSPLCMLYSDYLLLGWGQRSATWSRALCVNEDSKD